MTWDTKLRAFGACDLFCAAFGVAIEYFYKNEVRDSLASFLSKYSRGLG